MNTFGKNFRVINFGESHGKAIGAVIDGCQAGISIDEKFIASQLNKRRPNTSKASTNRYETDDVQILSGVYNGKTLGTPIALLIHNNDAQPNDYDWLKNTYRPSHADYTYEKKFGLRDHRGGGRASARLTAPMVAAGAIAQLILLQQNIFITSFVSKLYQSTFEFDKSLLLQQIDKKKYAQMQQAIYKNDYRVLYTKNVSTCDSIIDELKNKGDTCGGEIQTIIHNLPVGIGEPLFNKINASLAQAMFCINTVVGVSMGVGFAASNATGATLNDIFLLKNKKIVTSTNNNGGIQGGISNGMPIYFNTAFKPIATIKMPQKSITKANKQTLITAKGRHDVCAIPRAVPIVEAYTALVLVDLLLANKLSKV